MTRHPLENFGHDRPDFSYLDNVVEPRPHVYEGDALVGDEPGHDLEVLPRLTAEDGFVVNADGKPRFISPAVDQSDVRFDEPTGNSVSNADYAAEQHPLATMPTQGRAGTTALHGVNVRASVSRIYRSNAADGSHAKRQPVASHRSES